MPRPYTYTLSLHDALPIWTYDNLVSGFRIGMPMPQKLQPGPLAGQISLFAPVSLFFFFFLMFIITTMRGIDRSEEHTSELQSHSDLVCRLLLEKKKDKKHS